ncbi:hypothetical protein RI367_004193 [Sorochytrium milnesiophthora]
MTTSQPTQSGSTASATASTGATASEGDPGSSIAKCKSNNNKQQKQQPPSPPPTPAEPSSSAAAAAHAAPPSSDSSSLEQKQEQSPPSPQSVGQLHAVPAEPGVPVTRDSLLPSPPAASAPATSAPAIHAQQILSAADQTPPAVFPFASPPPPPPALIKSKSSLSTLPFYHLHGPQPPPQHQQQMFSAPRPPPPDASGASSTATLSLQFLDSDTSTVPATSSTFGSGFAHYAQPSSSMHSHQQQQQQHHLQPRPRRYATQQPAPPQSYGPPPQRGFAPRATAPAYNPAHRYPQQAYPADVRMLSFIPAETGKPRLPSAQFKRSQAAVDVKVLTPRSTPTGHEGARSRHASDDKLATASASSPAPLPLTQATAAADEQGGSSDDNQEEQGVSGDATADDGQAPPSPTLSMSSEDAMLAEAQRDPSQQAQLQQLLLNAPSNVYIRGLPPSTTDESLENMCKPFGNVISAKAIIDLRSGRTCKGYGFAFFEHIDDAMYAIQQLNSLGYQSSIAKESFSAKLKTLQDHGSTNIYISNLPLSMNEMDLEALFAPLRIVSTRVLRDPSGTSRDRESALEVISRFNHASLPGGASPLQVRFADSPAQKRLKNVHIRRKFQQMYSPGGRQDGDSDSATPGPATATRTDSGSSGPASPTAAPAAVTVSAAPTVIIAGGAGPQAIPSSTGGAATALATQPGQYPYMYYPPPPQYMYYVPAAAATSPTSGPGNASTYTLSAVPPAAEAATAVVASPIAIPGMGYQSPYGAPYGLVQSQQSPPPQQLHHQHQQQHAARQLYQPATVMQATPSGAYVYSMDLTTVSPTSPDDPATAAYYSAAAAQYTTDPSAAATVKPYNVLMYTPQYTSAAMPASERFSAGMHRAAAAAGTPSSSSASPYQGTSNYHYERQVNDMTVMMSAFAVAGDNTSAAADTYDSANTPTDF